NLLQLHEGDIPRALDTLGEMSASQRERLEVRSRCAWNWITTFSPEDFRYRLMRDDDPLVELNEQEAKAIADLYKVVEVMDEIDDKEYTTRLYDAAKDHGLPTGDFFKLVYRIMIGKDRGPKLGPFLKTCGREKVLSILGRY
ncbi:MAG: lysine--tRNA ligase, partial [Spirochaetales bacterium]|nr:lysine--tRNA ligase [Spirochaetales bacterium]